MIRISNFSWFFSPYFLRSFIPIQESQMKKRREEENKREEEREQEKRRRKQMIKNEQEGEDERNKKSDKRLPQKLKVHKWLSSGTAWWWWLDGGSYRTKRQAKRNKSNSKTRIYSGLPSSPLFTSKMDTRIHIVHRHQKQDKRRGGGWWGKNGGSGRRWSDEREAWMNERERKRDTNITKFKAHEKEGNCCCSSSSPSLFVPHFSFTSSYFWDREKEALITNRNIHRESKHNWI